VNVYYALTESNICRSARDERDISGTHVHLLTSEFSPVVAAE